MKKKSILYRLLKLIGVDLYKFIDSLYVSLDKQHILRTKNIRLIPNEENRRGGKYSYAEWAHVIGIFQTVIYCHLINKDSNHVIDIGCGTGFLAIACEPFIGEKGSFYGIDVSKKDIEFCKKHFHEPNFLFDHHYSYNPLYSPDQKIEDKSWHVDDSSYNLLTALSVWTHLSEDDAMYYIKEVDRVLKPGGIAIITVFLLDEQYYKSIGSRIEEKGKYHMTSQLDWIFDQNAYGSTDWFYPKRASIPENAIGISSAGLIKLLESTDLVIDRLYPGNWKEIPGVFFQDILVLKKTIS